MHPRLLIPAVFFGLAMSACGGGSSETRTTLTTVSLRATSTTMATPAAADATRAAELVLVANDFPPGWAGSPSAAESPETDAIAEEFVRCTGSSGEESESAHVSGDTFTLGRLRVSSDASFVKDDDVYRRNLAILKGPKFQPCLKETFTKSLSLGLGFPPSSVEVSPLPVPLHGDFTGGIRMTAQVTQQAQKITVYFDFVFMARNRAGLQATFVGFDQPFDKSLRNSLIDKLWARLAVA